MPLENLYPSIPYLAERAHRRIPFFAWEYLASGTGTERLVPHNRQALDPVEMDGPAGPQRPLHAGSDGIVVSDHGGRQFDAPPPAIDALPEIARGVGGRVKVLFDSGLEGGLDVMRAISRGADFCLFGRAFLYATGALGAAAVDALRPEWHPQASGAGFADKVAE